MAGFNGQIAFITGATGDIGKAIVKRLHNLGVYLFITGSNEKKLAELGKEIKTNYTVRVCDLSNLQAVESLLNDIERIDIMICNAGINYDTLAIKMTNEEFQKVIDINLTASFILNREVVKKMITKRYGRIINVSSVVAFSGNPGQINYCASKAGLIGMTKSLACEVATRGITVNAVAPGFIVSNMTASLTNAQKELITNKIPMKSFGSPDDVANVVSFLASQESSYITGQTIHVNGGMVMV